MVHALIISACVVLQTRCHHLARVADKIGNFLVGKYFDAIIVNPSVVGTPIDVHEDDTFQDVLSKFVYLGDDRNIRRVFVAGDEVVGEA